MTLSRSGGIVHLVLQLPSPPPEKTTRDPA
jgi:hypothetical protein